jgi:hypothetical protein
VLVSIRLAAQYRCVPVNSNVMQSVPSDPLVLAETLVSLGETAHALDLLETALLSHPDPVKIRAKLDQLVRALPEHEARERRKHADEMVRMRAGVRRSPSKLVGAASLFLILLLGAGYSVLVQFGNQALFSLGIACLGLASCGAIAGAWWRRAPYGPYGGVNHSERPVSYHICSFAMFLFCFMLLFAGVAALLK